MTRETLARFAARAAMVVGLGVGMLAIVVWSFGVRIQVPEWMWRVAIVKIGLAAALGLIGAGALLLRRLRRDEDKVAGREPRSDQPPAALGAPAWDPSKQKRERDYARLTTPPETPLP
jgi:hypothetical protein